MCEIYLHPKLDDDSNQKRQVVANLVRRGVILNERGHLVTPLESQRKHRVSWATPDAGEHQLTDIRRFVRGGYMHSDDDPEPPKPAA